MDLEFDSYDLVTDNKDSEYAPLPDGWYDARIMGADLRTTKAGNGRYIAVRYDITGSDYGGRVVWGNLNVNNPNPVAEQIGRKQLSQVAAAGGLTALPKNTDELIGLDVKIKVALRPATEQWPASNDVKDWKATENASKPPKADSAPANAPWAK
jgi:hypothetical protein